MDGMRTDQLINDKYTAIKKIGHGSYGSVYLARRVKGDGYVVLKRVFVVEEGSKEYQEAHNEVKMLQRLRHRNIVAYKDSFVHDGHLCIVMSYCAGGDIHSQIKAARQAGVLFTPDQVRLCSTISHVFARGLCVDEGCCCVTCAQPGRMLHG